MTLKTMRTALLSGGIVAGAILATLWSAAVETASAPTLLVDQDVHGRKGWILENGRIHVGIVKGGGHIANLSFISDNPRLSINPMLIPAGNGYMGHMVCFPNFGPASPEERESGIGGHGEANAVEWHETRPAQIDAQGLTFFYGAELPKEQFRIERAVSLKTGQSQIDVQQWIENLLPFDRPYNLNEHPTFGAPFAAPDAMVLDMPGTKAMSDPRRTGGNQWAPSREFSWPNAPKSEGGTLSLREFHAVPGGQVFTAVLADQSKPMSWFTIFNREYPLLVGYVFPTADHAWISDWQNQPMPGATQRMARGVLFGTSPWDEGLRKSVERGQLFGVPTYKFIAAKKRLSTSFTAFLVEIPVGFSGVRDVRLVNGQYEAVPVN
jgi:hypothetical protein